MNKIGPIPPKKQQPIKTAKPPAPIRTIRRGCRACGH
jgi:hypothetical protein